MFNSKNKQNTPDSSSKEENKTATKSNAIEVPSISLPKGGGAIKGIDEKFSVNAVNGTTGFSIPLPVSDARGFSPALGISYSSGAGNGVFGLGWSLGIPSIKRKTERELPQYFDGVDSDTFILSEAEDLVPEFKKDGLGNFIKDAEGDYVINEFERIFLGTDYNIKTYRPRIEGLFSRIERWTEKNLGYTHWRVISKSNITSLFGSSKASRIADSADDKRIFEWLLEFSFDDKGNCFYYEYKPENEQGLNLSHHHNKNRKEVNITYTNTYLKRVLYGIRTPYKNKGEVYPKNVADYFFETVFDYGEHDTANAPFDEIKEWDFRNDAFSDYRAGFEIRTTRLCKRVLLYHHFSELPGGSALIKSTDFIYDNNGMDSFTFLKEVVAKGYIKQTNGNYTQKALPPFSFEYQKHEWNKEIKSLNSEALVHAPIGTNNREYHFVDLFSEGLSGILTEQGNGWYYKSNLGEGNFTQAKLISPKPSFQGLYQQVQLMELEANGIKQLVHLNNEPKGFFELNPDEEWQPFKTFEEMPTIQQDAYSRMLDLNGDGLADLLISEPNGFTWYPSKGKKGYEISRKVNHSYDEELAPAIVFADSTQSIFLVDMSGDGLIDIVRIKNGEVCYWPNLGYARFGAKITMDNAPVFDHPDNFNPQYIKIADIDGSGTSDIIYIGKNKFSIYLNRQGNSFANEILINPFPEINNAVDIDMTDLLGTGLSCIVWNSPLPKDSNHPTHYIDLMNSKKPHIMVAYKNNLGKEVTMEYTASTKFYIEDKRAGKPWVTKLHFPVHCVSKTITEDKISGYKFVSEYKYHHGYYDHPEREFRGFGMVEQTDAETFEHWIKSGASNMTDATLHQEPIISKSWHHTGAFLQKDKILNQFAKDYWYEEMERQGFVVNHHEVALPDARLITAPGIDPTILDHLSAQEWQEALRACKGMALRSEVFANDAPMINASADDLKKQFTPFTVGTHNCIIELLQPRGKNKHAVFVVKESEAITYSYERNVEDPRITHTLNIKIDKYGNVLESASVVYPRVQADLSLPVETQQAQGKTTIIYTKNNFTKDVIGEDTYRLRLPSEVKTYELKGVDKSNPLYTIADFENILIGSFEVAYHQININPAGGSSQKRLIEHIRSIYLSNDLKTALTLGELDSLALPFENYQLAYTPELLNDIFGMKVNNAMMLEGKFTHSEGDNNWWIRSGTTQFIEGAETTTDAQNRFYVPKSYTDPYGSITKVKYYGKYNLFINETEDALGNKSGVDKFNFRTLSPQRMKDINGNFSEAISDELGLVKAVAIMGKGNEADELTGITEITDAAESASILSFFQASDSVQLTSIGKNLLNRASSRFVYDFEAYTTSGKPAVVAAITREQHFKQLANSPVQIGFEYSNGIGEVVMKKVQAEPGIAKEIIVHADNTYTLTTPDPDTSTFNPKQLRWIGNGRTIKNNKGNAVKQYEPYFSVTYRYEDLKELVETGVTLIMYYDAMGRLIKTEMPDDSFSKVEFDSWKQKVYDANDTVTDSDWYQKRTDNTRTDFINDAKEQIAATKVAKHANTPNVLHFDTLGRPVLSIDHNKNILTEADEFHRTKVKIDTEGNLRSVTDARELPENSNKGNKVMQYKYDMLGNKVYQNSMDAGQRWMLINILGNPLRNWDERDHEFRYFYDELHRPLNSVVINKVGNPGDEILNNIFDRIIYGESLLLPDRSNEAALQIINILGKPIKHFDTGGVVLTPEYDFKEQAKFTARQLFKNYKTVANWTDANLALDLENDPFTFTTETDALGRITQQTAPDGSIITPSYNEAGLLDGESVLHPGATVASIYIKDIDYNEKGQRNKIIYGNNVSTKFYYDKETFRLKRLESKRQNNDSIQDLYYTYDPVGNITTIEDKAIPISFFANSIIEPISEYTYDALYRLAEATGRENNAALNFGTCDNWNDKPFMHSMNPGDPMAIRNYTQRYQYDAVGNIMEMKHLAAGGNWTRRYEYETANNRIKSTHIGDNGSPADYLKYAHHPQHGFLIELPHLEKISWNFKEEVVLTTRQHCTDDNIPVITYYQYDGSGQRIRKITENQAAVGGVSTKKEERIYVAGYELYKKHSVPDAGLERVSLSLMDEGHRFVMIETRNDVDDGTEKHLVRYQLHNHLGSACLELNGTGDAKVISYEEYHPYGTTAYQAKNAAIKSAAKRYRYTGMERDEETGLEYHSARYYLPWLGRWLSADPIGMKGGVNVYEYAGSNPILLTDRNGRDPKDDAKKVEAFRPDVTTAFKDYVDSSTGLTENDLMALIFVESSGVPSAVSGTHLGLFQLQKSSTFDSREFSTARTARFNKTTADRSFKWADDKSILNPTTNIRYGTFVVNERFRLANEVIGRKATLVAEKAAIKVEADTLAADKIRIPARLAELKKLTGAAKTQAVKDEMQKLRNESGALRGRGIDLKTKQDHNTAELAKETANEAGNKLLKAFMAKNPGAAAYLLHQQGIAGLRTLLANPNDKLTEAQIKNLPQVDRKTVKTKGDFVKYWETKYNNAKALF